MVAHFTMRTYEVNQAFRFVEGIWLHRTRRQISEEDHVYLIRAQPSNIKTMPETGKA